MAGFNRSDVAFGFATGEIEHRTMDGTLIQTLSTTGASEVRGLAFDRSGNLYAVLEAGGGMIEKFDVATGASLGRWDTGVTWDSTHIPYDICFAVDLTAWVIWRDDLTTGTQHGAYQLAADGGSILTTWRLTASADYYGGTNPARLLKLDLNAQDTESDGAMAGYQDFFEYTDGYTHTYFHRTDLSSGGTDRTLDPTDPWEAAAVRFRPEDDRQILLAQTRADAPAGPRNALCLCADGTTLWADEINVAFDTHEPGVQHADRYQIADGTHVARVRTGVQQPILSMASWNVADGPVPAVCGDIFVGYRDTMTFVDIIGVFDGTTGARKGRLALGTTGRAAVADSACFDSAKNYYVAIFSESPVGGEIAGVLKFPPDGEGRYQTGTYVYQVATSTAGFGLTVSIDKLDNLYFESDSSGTGTLVKFRPDGTVLWTRVLPWTSAGVGGVINTDGTRFYERTRDPGFVIGAYDPAGDARLADYVNVPDDFATFRDGGPAWINGLLLGDEEDGDDAGAARFWPVTAAGAVFRDYPHVGPPAPSTIVEATYGVAVDFVVNSFVTAMDRDERGISDDPDHLVVARYNVASAVGQIVVDRIGSNAGALPIAVLCGAAATFPGAARYDAPGGTEIWGPALL